MSSSFEEVFNIVLYSHDTMGLGHIRRNILISQQIVSSFPKANVLIISGTRESNKFILPNRVDILTLPSLLKGSQGRYQAKNWDVSLRNLIQLRSNIILSSIEKFKPQILVADNVPRGACLELDETLKYIKEHLPTKVVLGLRDIKDDDQTVMREWRQQKYYDFLRDYYSEVWIYGDVLIYDWAEHCYFPEDLRNKMFYIGYLDQCRRLENLSCAKDSQRILNEYQLYECPYFLCLLGGGQDGFLLGQNFCLSQIPVGYKGVLLIGPHMNDEERKVLHDLVEKNPQLVLFDFLNEPTVLIQQATAIISMGGYNNVLEILSFEKQALIVPRVYPRTEQLIRAERLEHLNIVDCLHPQQLTSDALSHWMHAHCDKKNNGSRKLLNLNGLENLVERVRLLLVNSTEKSTDHAVINEEK